MKIAVTQILDLVDAQVASAPGSLPKAKARKALGQLRRRLAQIGKIDTFVEIPTPAPETPVAPLVPKPVRKRKPKPKAEKPAKPAAVPDKEKE